jgi:hypothetical protein
MFRKSFMTLVVSFALLLSCAITTFAAEPPEYWTPDNTTTYVMEDTMLNTLAALLKIKFSELDEATARDFITNTLELYELETDDPTAEGFMEYICDLFPTETFEHLEDIPIDIELKGIIEDTIITHDAAKATA